MNQQTILLQNRYQILRRLGKGGLGETWEVKDLNDRDKLKVVKVLLEDDRKTVELFKREAQVLKELCHPGIPKVKLRSYFSRFPRVAFLKSSYSY